MPARSRLDYVRLNIAAEAAGMSRRGSSCCRVTGSGPRSSPPRGAARRRSATSSSTSISVGGASIDAHGTALTDEVLEACREADAVLLGRGRRPEVGDDRPGRARGPSRGCSACARGWACTRTCARSGRARRCSSASPLRPERIEGTDLLVVRELTGGIYFGDSGARATAPTTPACTRSPRSSGSRGSPSSRRGGAASGGRGDLGRQGQRPRDLAAVARDGRARSRDEFSEVELEHMLVDNAAMQLVSDPARLRRDPDREHVRRHPQRRGGDAHRLARACCPRRASATGGPGLFEPVHGSRARHRRQGDREPARDLPLRGDDAAPRARPARRGRRRSRPRSRRPWSAACGPPTSALGRGPAPADAELPAEVEVGTEEMTDAVIECRCEPWPMRAYFPRTGKTTREDEPWRSAEYIWMNGEFVAWDDAKVHVLSHGLHYGTGVFEGIRCLRDRAGPGGLPPSRPPRAAARSRRSSTTWSSPTRRDELRDATHELIRRNGLASCYIRPLAFRGYGEMGLYAQTAPIDVMIAVWPWGAYLGEEGKRDGNPRQGLVLAPDLAGQPDPARQGLGPVPELDPRQDRERRRPGYDEAILLDERGFVCEGSGENIFMVRDGELVTPGHTSSILDGISRKSVIQIARDLGYTVEERDIAALGAVPGRGDLPHRDRRRAGPGARDRRPRPRRAGRDHARDPGQVRGRPARARAGVPRVAGRGRGKRVKSPPDRCAFDRGNRAN